VSSRTTGSFLTTSTASAASAVERLNSAGPLPDFAAGVQNSRYRSESPPQAANATTRHAAASEVVVNRIQGGYARAAAVGERSV
jgi:hypothetical protein